MNLKKRIVSMVLCVAMVVGMLPTFAQPLGQTLPGTPITELVYDAVGNPDGPFDFTEEGAIYTLRRDFTAPFDGILVTENATIDLKGHVLAAYLWHDNGHNSTLLNVSGSGVVVNVVNNGTTEKATRWFGNNCEIGLENTGGRYAEFAGGTLCVWAHLHSEVSGRDAAINVLNGATLNIEDGKVSIFNSALRVVEDTYFDDVYIGDWYTEVDDIDGFDISERDQCFCVGKESTLNLTGLTLFDLDGRIRRNAEQVEQAPDGWTREQVGGIYFTASDAKVYFVESVFAGSAITNFGTVNLKNCTVDSCGSAFDADFIDRRNDTPLFTDIVENAPVDVWEVEAAPAIYNNGILNVTGSFVNNSPIYNEKDGMLTLADTEFSSIPTAEMVYENIGAGAMSNPLVPAVSNYGTVNVTGGTRIGDVLHDVNGGVVMYDGSELYVTGEGMDDRTPPANGEDFTVIPSVMVSLPEEILLRNFALKYVWDEATTEKQEEANSKYKTYHYDTVDTAKPNVFIGYALEPGAEQNVHEYDFGVSLFSKIVGYDIESNGFVEKDIWGDVEQDLEKLPDELVAGIADMVLNSESSVEALDLSVTGLRSEDISEVQQYMRLIEIALEKKLNPVEIEEQLGDGYLGNFFGRIADFVLDIDKFELLASESEVFSLLKETLLPKDEDGKPVETIENLAKAYATYLLVALGNTDLASEIPALNFGTFDSGKGTVTTYKQNAGNTGDKYVTTIRDFSDDVDNPRDVSIVPHFSRTYDIINRGTPEQETRVTYNHDAEARAHGVYLDGDPLSTALVSVMLANGEEFDRRVDMSDAIGGTVNRRDVSLPSTGDQTVAGMTYYDGHRESEGKRINLYFGEQADWGSKRDHNEDFAAHVDCLYWKNALVHDLSREGYYSTDELSPDYIIPNLNDYMDAVEPSYTEWLDDEEDGRDNAIYVKNINTILEKTYEDAYKYAYKQFDDVTVYNQKMEYATNVLQYQEAAAREYAAAETEKAAVDASVAAGRAAYVELLAYLAGETDENVAHIYLNNDDTKPVTCTFDNGPVLPCAVSDGTKLTLMNVDPADWVSGLTPDDFNEVIAAFNNPETVWGERLDPKLFFVDTYTAPDGVQAYYRDLIEAVRVDTDSLVDMLFALLTDGLFAYSKTTVGGTSEMTLFNGILRFGMDAPNRTVSMYINPDYLFDGLFGFVADLFDVLNANYTDGDENYNPVLRKYIDPLLAAVREDYGTDIENFFDNGYELVPGTGIYLAYMGDEEWEDIVSYPESFDTLLYDVLGKFGVKGADGKGDPLDKVKYFTNSDGNVRIGLDRGGDGQLIDVYDYVKAMLEGAEEPAAVSAEGAEDFTLTLDQLVFFEDGTSKLGLLVNPGKQVEKVISRFPYQTETVTVDEVINLFTGESVDVAETTPLLSAFSGEPSEFTRKMLNFKLIDEIPGYVKDALEVMEIPENQPDKNTFVRMIDSSMPMPLSAILPMLASSGIVRVTGFEVVVDEEGAPILVEGTDEPVLDFNKPTVDFGNLADRISDLKRDYGRYELVVGGDVVSTMLYDMVAPMLEGMKPVYGYTIGGVSLGHIDTKPSSDGRGPDVTVSSGAGGYVANIVGDAALYYEPYFAGYNFTVQYGKVGSKPKTLTGKETTGKVITGLDSGAYECTYTMQKDEETYTSGKSYFVIPTGGSKMLVKTGVKDTVKLVSYVNGKTTSPAKTYNIGTERVYEFTTVPEGAFKMIVSNKDATKTYYAENDGGEIAIEGEVIDNISCVPFDTDMQHGRYVTLTGDGDVRISGLNKHVNHLMELVTPAIARLVDGPIKSADKQYDIEIASDPATFTTEQKLFAKVMATDGAEAVSPLLTKTVFVENTNTDGDDINVLDVPVTIYVPITEKMDTVEHIYSFPNWADYEPGWIDQEDRNEIKEDDADYGDTFFNINSGEDIEEVYDGDGKIVGIKITTRTIGAIEICYTSEFPVSFDGETPTDVTFGDPIEFPNPNPTMPNHTFLGWKGSNGVFLAYKADPDTYAYKMPDVSGCGNELNFTSVWQEIGGLTVTVKNKDGAVVGAQVKLMQNGAQVDAQKTTDAEGKAIFENLPYGAYNVEVLDTNNVTTTVGKDISGDTNEVTVTVPTAKLNTVVDTKDDIGMNLTVENLDKAITEKPVVTANGSTEITIKLEVKAVEPGAASKAKINAKVVEDNASSAATVEMVDFVDLTVTMTTQNYNAAGAVDGEAKDVRVTTTSDYQIISVEISDELYGKLAAVNGGVENILVYRLHGEGAQEEIAQLRKMPNETAGKNARFECYWLKEVEGKDYVVLKVKNFSTYAIGYQDEEVPIYEEEPLPVSPSVPVYAITGADTENGKLTLSTRYTYAGSTVTITVTPDEGYELESLTALDVNGKALTLTDLGDGKYSFKMPGSKVTVKATFKEKAKVETPFFVDVPEGKYYYDAVKWAVENGITKGTDKTHFSPNALITRADVVTFLWRAAGSPEPTDTTVKFTDVRHGSYYEKAVAWAIEQGITNGTSKTTFTPGRNCKRGEIVTFLARFAGVKDTKTASTFTDVLPTRYYAAAVKWAVDNGVTNGTSKTTFSPNALCKRAEAITFLYRWMVK